MAGDSLLQNIVDSWDPDAAEATFAAFHFSNDSAELRRLDLDSQHAKHVLVLLTCFSLESPDDKVFARILVSLQFGKLWTPFLGENLGRYSASPLTVLEGGHAPCVGCRCCGVLGRQSVVQKIGDAGPAEATHPAFLVLQGARDVNYKILSFRVFVRNFGFSWQFYQDSQYFIISNLWQHCMSEKHPIFAGKVIIIVEYWTNYSSFLSQISGIMLDDVQKTNIFCDLRCITWIEQLR